MSISLQAQTRTERGRKTDILREQDIVPGVVYGADVKPASVSVRRGEFVKAYAQAGTSGLVSLSLDGAVIPVLIHDIDQHPLTSRVSHIDFRAVDLKKEIEAEVQIRLSGEAGAVKTLGGTMVNETTHVKVRALPTALVPFIEVDVSRLATFEDAVRVKDLVVPAGMKIEEDAELTIVMVMPPRTDAELEALNTAVEENIEAVEVAKKEKKEEEPVEGEEAPKPKKE